jgi:hypothetical protein
VDVKEAEGDAEGNGEEKAALYKMPREVKKEETGAYVVR